MTRSLPRRARLAAANRRAVLWQVAALLLGVAALAAAFWRLSEAPFERRPGFNLWVYVVGFAALVIACRRMGAPARRTKSLLSLALVAMALSLGEGWGRVAVEAVTWAAMGALACSSARAERVLPLFAGWSLLVAVAVAVALRTGGPA